MSFSEQLKKLTDKQLGTVLEHLEAEYLRRGTQLNFSLGAIANRKVFGTMPSSDELLASLASERQERARAVISSMARKYSRNSGEFGVVATHNEELGQRYFVLLAAETGLPMSVSERMGYSKENEAKFLVDIDGEKVDTRAAMDKQLYSAFVEASFGRKEVPFVNPTRGPYKWCAQTWLLGERSVFGNICIGYVKQDETIGRFTTRHPGRNYSSIHFRPAIEI